MTRIVRVLLLTAMWIVLWSDISIANVLSGLLVAVAIVAALGSGRPGRVVVRPVAVARFVLHFFVQLAVSTLVVARTVLTPRHRIRSGIIAVPLHGCSDAVATLIADAISLTPGTLTVEVRREPLTLYVHALDVRDITVLQREVRVLEMLAVKAFGDVDAIASHAQDDTNIWRSR